MDTRKRREVDILLVDDDAIDRELFIEAMNSSPLKCSIIEAAGGEEALKFLEETETPPQIILLDLNMPLKDGRETLKEIKANKKLKYIPIVVFSTSNANFDVRQAYELGASLFLEKPHDFKQLSEMITCLLCLIGKYASFARYD